MKSPLIYGLVAKLESSYLGGGSLSTSTDGIELAELPTLSIDYGYDGARRAPPGTTGSQRRVAPIAPYASTTLKFEPKGSGQAYGASVTPVGHVLRRLAGFDAAVTTTGGSEKWVYTPTPGPTSYGSGVMDLYGLGEKYPLTGVYGDWTVGAEGAEIPLEEIAIQGVLGAVDDASVPAITYPYETIVPPTSVGAGLFSLGDFTAGVIRKWQIKANRAISRRQNQNSAGGSAGLAIGRRNFTLEVTFETPAFATTPYHATSTLDAKRLYESAAELAWEIQIGSVQYNRRTLAGPAAQIAAKPDTKPDGDVVVTTLQLQLNPSVLGANDEITDTWD